MSDPDLWKIMLKDEVLTYLDSYPTDDQLEMFSNSNAGLGCRKCFVDGVIQTGYYMDMGLFGAEDYYFFYMKFVPPQSAMD